ncbi:MAG: branched-chain amino acid ABC transporter permease [Alphaproteobacteria bacterium]|nr:branched-chain amino acid ABC transporter permease [Alphaproteobacteria bacterium]
MNYVLHLVILFDIYFIVAMSLNIVVGYCGLLTLSHAAFFGIGTYAYALSVQAWGWDFLSAAALGIGLAALASLILSLAAWRFRGDFFVLISLSIQFALFSVINNWHSPREAPGTLANLTNGPYGLEGIPRPSIFGFTFESIESIVILFTALAVLFALLCRKLLASPWGRMLQAMRDDELAARGLGKRVRLAKVQAIAFACAMAGFAGVLYASYISFIDPATASLTDSLLLLTMIIIGGVGNTFRGPLVGAFVLLAIPEALRFADLPDQMAAELRLLIFGILLIGMMHLRPQGLAGNYRLG